MKKIFLLITVLFSTISQSQIVVDNNAPYNSPAFLVDDILLGGGVVLQTILPGRTFSIRLV